LKVTVGSKKKKKLAGGRWGRGEFSGGGMGKREVNISLGERRGHGKYLKNGLKIDQKVASAEDGGGGGGLKRHKKTCWGEPETGNGWPERERQKSVCEKTQKQNKRKLCKKKKELWA